MRARLLCEFETPEAGFRVTEASERVEFLVRVGSAAFSAKLTEDQAYELEDALRRRRYARSELRQLRAVPRRVTTKGA